MPKSINILIAFAQKDNESDSINNQGWVSHFKIFLELVFHQITNEKPNIMLKHDDNSITTSELDSINFFIAVMSNNFIVSEKCLDILKMLEKNGLLDKVKQTARVMKLFMSPSKQPLAIQKAPEYNMYSPDKNLKTRADFLSQEAEGQYWMEMIDLAYDIQEEIGNESPLHIKDSLKHKTVFLAETDQELSIRRDIIERELVRHGCAILPNATLPIQQAELENIVKKNLEESDFSIHLIGGDQTKTLEGTNQSIVAMQNRLAARQNTINTGNGEKGRKLYRLIWMSPSTKTTTDEQQKSFIDRVKRDIDLKDKIEISEAPFEEFKSLVRDKIIIHTSYSDKPEKDSKQKKLYFIYDQIDTQAAKPYIEIIEKVGFVVLKPPSDGEFIDVKRKHTQSLRAFDVAIIFKNKVGDLWVQMKILDILKSPGVGRSKPILGRAIVSPVDDNSNLESFENHGITLIGGGQNKSLESVEHFLTKII